MKKAYLSLLLSLFCGMSTAFATDYYVSADGNDANDGSISSPWKTLAKASEAADKASNGGFLNPGDRLLFRRGDTFEGNLYFLASGTEAEPIQISSYGSGELPIISGSGNVAGGDYFEAIKLVNASHIIVSDLWIKNDRRNNNRFTYGETKSFGIQVVANKWGGVSSNLTFRDLKVSDVYGVNLPADFDELSVTGIRFESEANDGETEVGVKDVLIEDCYFTHIGKAGVWAVHKGDAVETTNRNQNFVIRNNTFFQTGGSGVILSKMYNALVENNDFDHTGYSSASEPRLVGRGSGMWVFKCINVIGQYNRSISVRGSGDSYGMHIDFGNKNIIYQYNYSEDSEGGFVEVLGDNHNVAYRFNVSVNDGFRSHHGSTIWTSGYVGSGNTPVPSDDVYVYNNTVYLASNYKPDITLFSEDTYIYNNIFVQTGGGVIGEVVDIDIQNGGDFVVANNLFNGNISSAFSNLDNSAVFSAPSFHNAGATNIEGYKIYAGSGAVDAGKTFPEPSFPMAGQGIFANISANPTTDIYGNSVDVENLLPNIGADNNHNSGIDPGAITLLNGDFEEGLTYWSSWNSPTITSDAQSGSKAIKMVDKGSFYQWANVEKNTDYVLTAYIKISDTSQRVVFTAKNADDATLGTLDASNANYTKKKLTFNTGNSSTVKVSNWLPPSGGASAYVDNITLVKAVPVEPVDVTGVSISNQSLTLSIGVSQQLNATIIPADATNQNVTWSSNNNAVATVNASGNITAVSEGSATITATTQDGGFTATTTVSVNSDVVTEVLNNGFENGLTNWNSWATVTIGTGAYHGSSAAKLTGPSSVNQWVDVKPNTTYTLSAFAKVNDPENDRVVLGVNDENDDRIADAQIYDTEYTLHHFTFTTGANVNTVKVFFWRPANGVNSAFVDEIVLKETAYVLNADFEKGLSAWGYYGGTTTETSSPISGGTSLKIDGQGGSSQMIKTKPATTYEISFTSMVADPSKEVKFHVKDASGSKYFEQSIFDTQATNYSITFTTNAGEEDSKVGFWRGSGAVGNAWLDNVSIKEVSGGARFGITEVDKLEVFNLQVYPNPASDFVTISSNQTNGIKSLVLYNLVGQPVLSQKFTTEYKLSVADLNKGTYILMVTDQSGNRKTSKLFVD